MPGRDYESPAIAIEINTKRLSQGRRQRSILRGREAKSSRRSRNCGRSIIKWITLNDLGNASAEWQNFAAALRVLQKISPVLHHLRARFQVKRMVVCSTNGVARGVRKLQLDVFMVVVLLVQDCRGQRTPAPQTLTDSSQWGSSAAFSSATWITLRCWRRGKVRSESCRSDRGLLVSVVSK